jgi:hypothetical protein
LILFLKKDQKIAACVQLRLGSHWSFVSLFVAKRRAGVRALGRIRAAVAGLAPALSVFA